jgi:hypothetical protein
VLTGRSEFKHTACLSVTAEHPRTAAETLVVLKSRKCTRAAVAPTRCSAGGVFYADTSSGSLGGSSPSRSPRCR